MKIYNNNINMEIDINELLKKNEINITAEKIVEIYNNSGRVYHNFNHIFNMLKSIRIYSEELIIAILFHDIVYKYDSTYNEIDSYNFFIENYNGNDEKFKTDVKNAIVAAMKKNSSIALGNIVGSNIFNILLVIGISSIINPIKITSSEYFVDFGVMIISAMVLFVTMFSIKKATISRIEGFIMFTIYIIYIYYSIVK